jgi:hypothetical protein
VGTWRRSQAQPRNAVIARFDRRGRLNYRIVARGVQGQAVAALMATSTSLPDINLRPPYAGLSADALRVMIDQHLRLPRNQRP